jgi:hypothetical protein
LDWAGLGWIGLVGLDWISLGWTGLGWIGSGWVGLGCIGLGCVFICSLRWSSRLGANIRSWEQKKKKPYLYICIYVYIYIYIYVFSYPGYSRSVDALTLTAKGTTNCSQKSRGNKGASKIKYNRASGTECRDKQKRGPCMRTGALGPRARGRT